MPVEDMQVTVAVRRRLVSAWVDVTRLNVRTTRGVVHIGGHMKRMTHEHSEMYPKLLQQLDLNIRSLKDVRDVRYSLDNWEKNVYGAWLPLKAEAAAGVESVTPQAVVRTVETVDVTKEEEELTQAEAENQPKPAPPDPGSYPST